MGFYYIQTTEENIVFAKSDLAGVINRSNCYRISKELYESDIVGKGYNPETKEFFEIELPEETEVMENE
jgi:hypothetical protein